ncbi:MAG: glycosyltransferase family 4 protein, partial [Gemmatimonadaceae bacterium]|nr:glycosyltransferase family 4 protein [Gemmatimonadaceae bacterium]
MTLHTLQIGMEWFTEEPGGLNRVYAHLLHELRERGVATRGLVVGSSDVARASAGLADAFAPVSVPLIRRMHAMRRAARPWLRAHRTDGVVVSHFALNAFPILDRLRDQPFVVHFQGPWGQESLLEGAPRMAVMAKELLEGLVYRRANRAIVLSEAFGEILHTRFGVARERIHVIPGGVEAARFTTDRSRTACRDQLGWPTDRPIVLCVRRLVRRVGLGSLIQAAEVLRRLVPDVLVLIAGKGYLRAELEAHITSLGLEDTVRLLGFFPDADLPTAYRAADLTAVPSVALEGFGLVAA